MQESAVFGIIYINLIIIIFVTQLEVAPCDSKGREYTEKDDMFVDSPDELVGKEVNFSFKIINCRGLPNKYTVILVTVEGRLAFG